MKIKEFIREFFFFAIRLTGIPFIIRNFIQKNKISIILFHNIDIDSASRLFPLISKFYNPISLKNYIEKIYNPKKNRKLPDKSLILTFDDGYKENYKLLPIIKETKIPITIFLCTSIIDTNRKFWFNIGFNLKNRNYLKRINNVKRKQLLKEFEFNESKEKPKRETLNEYEIRKMKKNIDFQSHSQFHPILTNCQKDIAWKEIYNSKKDLENIYNFQIYAFSFPNGDYSKREINFVKKAGYKCSITVDPGYNTLNSNPYTLKRFCISDKAKYHEVIVKLSGFWGFIKRIKYI